MGFPRQRRTFMPFLSDLLGCMLRKGSYSSHKHGMVCSVSHSAVVTDISPLLSPGRYREHDGVYDPAQGSKRAPSVPDIVATLSSC